MPRLRRARMNRRERPQLNTAIWKWLKAGRSATENLSDATEWEIFFLESGEKDPDSFWNRVKQAVLDGQIEISETKVHYQDDPLLPPSRNESEASRS